MEWSLQTISAADVDELMTWFPDAGSVDIWGGPRFRYPFTTESFHQDCRWQEFSSYSLRDPDGQLAAFGQIGDRYERAHLARLIANPTMRGQGVGRRLVESLVDVARQERRFKKIGLFVYQHNESAYQCYLATGFTLQPYPDDAPMREVCFYLTRAL